MAKKTNLKMEECRLINVNLAAEGSQENPTSRTDLNYEGIADKKVLAHLLGCATVDGLWNEDGQVLWLGVTYIGSRLEIKDCTMKFLGESIAGVKVKKFEFKPVMNGMIEIKCQAQVHHTPAQLTMIDSWQKKVGVLEIQTTQGDLFADDNTGEPEPGE